MKSDIQKIRDLVNSVYSRTLAGSNLTKIQRNCQRRIDRDCYKILEILDGMEKKGE